MSNPITNAVLSSSVLRATIDHLIAQEMKNLKEVLVSRGLDSAKVEEAMEEYCVQPLSINLFKRES